MTVAEMELGFQKIWDLFAATDRKFIETDREFKDPPSLFHRRETRRKHTFSLRFPAASAVKQATQ